MCATYEDLFKWNIVKTTAGYTEHQRYIVLAGLQYTF